MPLPTRRLRLIAPGLSVRLLRVRKVMGSPSSAVFCAVSAAVDWARLLADDSNEGDDNNERDAMCAARDEGHSNPFRQQLLFDVVVRVVMIDERDLVTVLPAFFDDTRAMHLMASDAPVDIILIASWWTDCLCSLLFSGSIVFVAAGRAKSHHG